MKIEWSPSPYGINNLEEAAATGYRTPGGPLCRGDEVRCCIRGCDKWIARRTRKGSNAYCSEHGISISLSPTYVYQAWDRNFIIAQKLLKDVVKNKVESWRLGNERSEDALSWNVFLGIAQLGGLGEVFEKVTGHKSWETPELFLWGVKVWPTPSTNTWCRLLEVRENLKEGSGIPTEPDIMLRVPNQALVLIEAKFGSPNGTLDKKLKSSVTSFPDHSPESAFLDRYPAASERSDPLDRSAIRDNIKADRLLEQLCRNVIFAGHLADVSEEPFVANLVRASAEDDVNVKKRMDEHLSPDARARFQRVTWEDLAGLPVMDQSDAAPLRAYLKNKTLNLLPAFSL